MPIFIDEKKCTGCESCVSVCPSEAISIINNIAVIDHNICRECLLCMDECPSNAIYQVLDREDSVIQREDFVPKSENFDVPQPKSFSWPDLRKQQMTGTVAMLLSGLIKLTGNFFKENSYQSRRMGGRGKHIRRHRRW